MNVNTADIDPVNQKNLKALENGGTIKFVQKGAVILIGDHHKKEIVEELKNEKKGTIVITKGSGKDPGLIEVTNCPGRAEMEQTIKRISKKKVVYK
jgi:hypothetical protein